MDIDISPVMARERRITRERGVAGRIREQRYVEGKAYHCHDCQRIIYRRKFGGRWVVDSLIIHHIRPLPRGGKSTDENLVALCNDCHLERHRQLRHNPELPLDWWHKTELANYDSPEAKQAVQSFST